MVRKDYDGFLTLLLSFTLIVLLLGVSYLLTFAYILIIAIKASCDNKSSQQIVVPGKRLRNNLPDNDYLQRLDQVLSIVAVATNKQVYILGGITGDASVSEARAGQNYLEDNNIQTSKIYLEEKSRDTRENMKQLKTCSTITDRHICLITNRYHLAHASILAQGFGFIVERCAAEDSFTPSIVATVTLFAEAFFLHWYLAGCIYAKLTRNQRMLSRIQ